jgi:hypothetical protein
MRALFLCLPAAAAPASAQSVLFYEGFESGMSAWTIGPDQPLCPWGHGVSNCAGTWMQTSTTDPCAPWALPFPAGQHVARFGAGPGLCTIDVGFDVPDCSMITAQPIALPALSSGSITLSFWSKSEGEDKFFYDRRLVFVSANGGGTWSQVGQVWNSDWMRASFDVTPWAGQTVLIKFKFAGEDNAFNDYHGWYVDEILLESTLEAGASFCWGDGSAADCPCGNFGAAGRGCASSIEPSGAQLAGSGNAQVAADSLLFSASGLSQSVVTFFQGQGPMNFELGATFGDGLRCAGGTTVRLRTVFAPGGMAQIPGAGDASLHTLGGIPPQGGSRTYQVWYRNAADFCTSATWNLTNGLQVHWRP